MANFRTKARAIDLLGRNQIADLPTAITELWKNGYDAYGDYLDAGLYRAGYKDVKYDIFTISDDGFGMNESDILNKWIVIGTDNKKNSDNFIPLEDRFGKEERVPLGEKGIGRLSVTYLGNHMLMITKKLNQPFQLVFMNWKALENYQLYLDEVEIPTAEILNLEQINEKYQYLQELYLENFQSESWKNFINLKEDILSEIAKYKNVPTAVMKKVQNHFQEKGHGTYFIIFDPINEIVDLEKEQESNLKEEQEDISEQTKYVRSALSGLFNPFDKKLLEERKNILGEDIGKTPSFTIYTPDGNEHDFLQLKDFFSEEEFTSCEHWIDGSFDDTGCFSGKIKVFGKVEEYSYISRKRPKCKIGNLRLKLAFWEGAKANTSMSEEKWHLYENKGEVFSGLYVYRDGFRVLPYGRTDFDFLEFEKNRSKSAGIYYFSHRKMFGFIGITKKENSRLIDKSGREGFVANDAYRAMKTMLMEFFKQIAKEKYGTNSEQRKEQKEQNKKKKEREDLIKQEKKRNYQAVVQIRKQIMDNRKVMEEKKNEILILQKEIDTIILKKKTLNEEARDVFAKLGSLKRDINALRINVSPDITLTGNDSINDLLHDYEDDRDELEKVLEDCDKTANEHVYVNILKDEYSNKYALMKKEIEGMFDTVEKSISENFKEISKQLDKKVLASKSIIYRLSPTEINIDLLSEEETIKRMEELDIVLNSVRQEYENVYFPFIKQFENITFEKDYTKTLEAYKSKEIELTKQIDSFYELAQIGMSIEVIDHQFNVLYAQIASALSKLGDMSKKSSEVLEIYNPLKMSFQHLESNHKMLMPMYRTTRRNKTNISGRDIVEVIDNFYGKVLKRDGIEFVYSEEFANYTIYSFESIIMPVFLNIINNAIYWVAYGNERKRIEIKIRDNEILIMNSGAKMSYTELTRCFEIFYTKKASGRGIGLYLAKKCLNSIDMDIYATNDKEYNILDGACFVICQHEGE